MPEPPHAAESIMARLEGLGHEAVRRTYARQGRTGEQFGVKMGDLRALAKPLKTDHPLGLALWATGNADARMLATFVLDPRALDADALTAMLTALDDPPLADRLTDHVIARSAEAGTLRERWRSSVEPRLGRAGWRLVIARLKASTAAPEDLDALLATLEAEMLAAPKAKQEAMNECLVTIGTRFAAYTERCVAVGERLGRFDDRPVPKGCTAPYAPDWIAAVLQRRSPSA